jgi:glucan phosphoethanolaminetransferase (alkaline phosphatase superfamily)
VTAVLGALAVVAVTVLAVWALRPGTASVSGTGGIAHRQPRATWLIVTAIVVAVLVIWYVRVSRRWKRRANVAVPGSILVITVIAVVLGVLWPNGLLRHYVSLAPATTTTTTPGRGTTSTTAKQATSTAPAATTTTANATTSSSG